MRALLGTLLLVIAGCGGSKEVCEGVSGTCVSLTVQSATITSIEGLHIVSTGAIDGTHDTSGPSTSLPLHVALQLPPMVSGAWHLAVDATVGNIVRGSCIVDTTITAGKHTTAICDLLGSDADLAGLDLSDVDLTGADLSNVDASTPFKCDPSIATGATACVWRWQTPTPQGDDILSLVSFGDSDVFALTKAGLLMHRDATGWTVMSTRPGVPYSASSMFGAANTLYITGSAYVSNKLVPVVFRSVDKGVSWPQESLPGALTGFGGNQGSASNANNVVVPTQSGNYYVRDDLGAWTLQTTGTTSFYGSAAHLGSFVIVGHNGSSASIAYSTNNGASFTASTTYPAGTLQVSGACIGGGASTDGYWVVGNGVILHSTGTTLSTWTTQGAAVTTGIGLTGCAATSDTTAWAWGNGTVLYTVNGGTTWLAVTTPPVGALGLSAGAHSPSGGTALTVAGDAGGLFRATDGLNFTSELKGLHDPLTAVFGVAPGILYAVGPAGTIYRTLDGGLTWTKLSLTQAGTTADLDAVWGSSATDIYALGTLGGNQQILHSSNGISFTLYGGILPMGTALKDLWGSAAHGVYAVGKKGTVDATQRLVLRTTNQGAAWSEVPIVGFTDGMNAANIANTTFSLGADVWLGGSGGLLFHSTDGTNFTAQSPGVATLAFARIRGITNHLIASVINDPGTFVDSANGGVSWNAPPPMPPWGAAAFTLAFTPNEDRIFAVCPSSQPSFSTDKGATWKALGTGIIDEQQGISDIFAFAANDVFAVGKNGIIHYGN